MLYYNGHRMLNRHLSWKLHIIMCSLALWCKGRLVDPMQDLLHALHLPSYTTKHDAHLIYGIGQLRIRHAILSGLLLAICKMVRGLEFTTLALMLFRFRIEEDGTLPTKVFTKTANKGITLHHQSHHPTSTKRAIARNEFRRAVRNSTLDGRSESVEAATKKLRDNGFPQEWTSEAHQPTRGTAATSHQATRRTAATSHRQQDERQQHHTGNKTNVSNITPGNKTNVSNITQATRRTAATSHRQQDERQQHHTGNKTNGSNITQATRRTAATSHRQQDERQQHHTGNKTNVITQARFLFRVSFISYDFNSRVHPETKLHQCESGEL